MPAELPRDAVTLVPYRNSSIDKKFVREVVRTFNHLVQFTQLGISAV